MPELKPCPFCGGKAELLSMGEKFTVSCGTGGCMASISWCPDDQSAIAAWNTRASDWIPCSERMPENETEGLIFCPDLCDRIKKAMFIEDGFYEERTDLIVKPGEYCTHWMPLPEPPKEDHYAG